MPGSLAGWQKVCLREPLRPRLWIASRRGRERNLLDRGAHRLFHQGGSKMTHKQSPNDKAASTIDSNSENSIRQWAERLNVSPDQIRDAINQVGPVATDIEMHLKGSRSTTNEQRTEAADEQH
tara:strand:- start:211 stop:579 length:369 start_codon:yes stop_codon:yes gene_type:complete